MDISKLPLQELKALAYDELAKQELIAGNLQAINNEISKRHSKSEKIKNPITKGKE